MSTGANSAFSNHGLKEEHKACLNQPKSKAPDKSWTIEQIIEYILMRASPKIDQILDGELAKIVSGDDEGDQILDEELAQAFTRDDGGGCAQDTLIRRKPTSRL